MATFSELKDIYDRLGTDEKLKSVKPEDLFSQADFLAVSSMKNDGETSEYRATQVGDLYIRVVHRPFRLDPTAMIYIFNLDQANENLYNDDLYWRSEPVKFCHGLPDYQGCLAAIQKLLDFRCDSWESKSKVLNIPWDPKKPDFDS